MAFNIPAHLDAALRKTLQDIQADLFALQKSVGGVRTGATGTPSGVSSSSSAPSSSGNPTPTAQDQIYGDFYVHGNLFVDGWTDVDVDRLTSKPTGYEWVLTDTGGNMVMTGSAGDLYFKQAGDGAGAASWFFGATGGNSWSSIRQNADPLGTGGAAPWSGFVSSPPGDFSAEYAGLGVIDLSTLTAPNEPLVILQHSTGAPMLWLMGATLSGMFGTQFLLGDTGGNTIFSVTPTGEMVAAGPGTHTIRGYLDIVGAGFKPTVGVGRVHDDYTSVTTDLSLSGVNASFSVTGLMFGVQNEVTANVPGGSLDPSGNPIETRGFYGFARLVDDGLGVYDYTLLSGGGSAALFDGTATLTLLAAFGHTAQISHSGEGLIEGAYVYRPQLYLSSSGDITNAYIMQTPTYAQCFTGTGEITGEYVAFDIRNLDGALLTGTALGIRCDMDSIMKDNKAWWFGTAKDVGIYGDGTAGRLVIAPSTGGVDTALYFEGGAGAGHYDGVITWLTHDAEWQANYDFCVTEGSLFKAYSLGLDKWVQLNHNDTNGIIQTNLGELILYGHSGVTIGVGTDTVDYTLKFDGNAYDGTFTWLEDEAILQFDNSFLLLSALEAAAPILYLRNTSTAAYEAEIRFEKYSVSPAASDRLGSIDWYGNNLTPAPIPFAFIEVSVADPSATVPSADFQIYAKFDNSFYNVLRARDNAGPLQLDLAGAGYSRVLVDTRLEVATDCDIVNTLRAQSLIADGDASGGASTNTVTGTTDTPTATLNWATCSTLDLVAPDGYIKAYVGTQAVVIPYWNT